MGGIRYRRIPWTVARINDIGRYGLCLWEISRHGIILCQPDHINKYCSDMPALFKVYNYVHTVGWRFDFLFLSYVWRKLKTRCVR